MKSRKILILLILSLAFNLAFVSTFAYRLLQKDRSVRNFQRRGHSIRESIQNKLNLTEEQRRRREELHRELVDKIRKIRRELGKERRVLGDLILSENPDSALIEEKIGRIGKLQTEMEKEVVYQIFKEKAIYTPEQRKYFLDMIRRRLKYSGRRRTPEKADQESSSKFNKNKTEAK